MPAKGLTIQGWKAGAAVTLESANYRLRSMTPEDVSDRYVAWAGDAELMQNLSLPARRVSRAQLQRYIAKFDNKTRFHLGVYCKKTGQQIGFFTIYCDPRHRNAQTNVVIGDRDYWGKGVVLETRAMILDFLFDSLAMEKVWGAPFARNFPSIFNYKAQGFTLEGVLRKHGVNIQGERVDQYQFGLLREEWRARKSKQGS